MGAITSSEDFKGYTKSLIWLNASHLLYNKVPLEFPERLAALVGASQAADTGVLEGATRRRAAAPASSEAASAGVLQLWLRKRSAPRLPPGGRQEWVSTPRCRGEDSRITWCAGSLGGKVWGRIHNPFLYPSTPGWTPNVWTLLRTTL